MNITAEQADILREHSFKWYKDNCTDRVTKASQVIPIENGFAVFYSHDAALAVSIARISQIEWKDDPSAEWIYVHWEDIVDYRWDEMPKILELMRNIKANETVTEPS